MSPDEYFTENRLLTLDDCSQYEKFLKQFLINSKDNNKTTEILNELKSTKPIDNTKENIISFIRNCNNKEMIPMIIFNND